MGAEQRKLWLHSTRLKKSVPAKQHSKAYRIGAEQRVCFLLKPGVSAERGGKVTLFFKVVEMVEKVQAMQDGWKAAGFLHKELWKDRKRGRNDADDGDGDGDGENKKKSRVRSSRKGMFSLKTPLLHSHLQHSFHT